MEIVRQQLGNGDKGEFRSRQLTARRCSHGELDGPELEEFVEQRLMTTTLEKAGQLGPRQRVHARHVRPRLLRDRDDGRGQRRAWTSRASASRPSARPRARPT